ncbi:efflux RND transporter periplasmic adaptor subunit [Brevundimonas staleyi]|uniref:Efflux RND transporter periplasmic adaptor subunit n=1 Tax=Brevundimonas staleyi TaxID=74326 RepID=A0ABW0FQJ7_9CAUL|nr:efflux RND transporter periplasmic adaptor subunit [Brevundimonas diminuta]MDM8353459.1 efflux RND transporter periplasmic adaptor subunit [Brevundimonas diminuta]
MKRTQMNKTWLMAGAGAAVVLGGAGIFVMTRSPSDPPASVGAEQAEGEEGHAGGAGGEEGVVVLTAAQTAAANISVVAVTRGGGGETRLSGRVEPMVDGRAAVAASVGGRVERVLVVPGQSVRAGQPLAVLVSGDAATYRADADAAAASADAARRAYERDRSLEQAGVVARQDVETSRAQSLSAEASARAARARAWAAGSPNSSGRLSVASPISGVVTSVQVGPGGFAAQGGVIAEITNPARVEIVFNAPPALAAQVRAGSSVRVQGPAGEFDAVVTGVAPGAGADSGGTVIRARPAGGNLPPAGSAVSGSVVTGEAVGGLTVPSEAIQTVEGASVVFVRTAEGFRTAPVLVGREAGNRTEILSGLTGAERIAGANAFLLKAELAKGEAGDDD